MSTWKKWPHDEKIRQTYYIREELNFLIRKFFRNKKFHEVETPILLPALIPESYYEYFKTHLLDRNLQKKTLFLSASPESSLKKLLTAGFGNCFEITKSFRNTEIGSNIHNPEFTMLEWYMVNADYKNSMDLLKNLFQYLIVNLRKKKLLPHFKGNLLPYNNLEIDMSRWEKISIRKAFNKYCGIDFNSLVDKNANSDNDIFSVSLIKTIARKKGYLVDRKNTWEEIFNQIYLNEIEPNLGIDHPTIIYDFPKPLAALAKLKSDNKLFAQRFELYIGNLELADCYTELDNWQEQQIRFDNDQYLRKKCKKYEITPDSEYIAALKKGLPDSSGVALGIDRTVMLFAGVEKIQDTLFFPLDY